MFFGCVKDVTFLHKSIPRLLEADAPQLSDNSSDIADDDHLKDSARVYQAAVKIGS